MLYLCPCRTTGASLSRVHQLHSQLSPLPQSAGDMHEALWGSDRASPQHSHGAEQPCTSQACGWASNKVLRSPPRRDPTSGPESRTALLVLTSGPTRLMTRMMVFMAYSFSEESSRLKMPNSLASRPCKTGPRSAVLKRRCPPSCTHRLATEGFGTASCPGTRPFCHPAGCFAAHTLPRPLRTVQPAGPAQWGPHHCSEVSWQLSCPWGDQFLRLMWQLSWRFSSTSPLRLGNLQSSCAVG